MTARTTKVSMVPGNVATAQPLLARAEQADGAAPISDQALLAAGQGQRELFLFTEGDSAPVAVGVVGQGELDLVVDPQHRARGIGSHALELLRAHAPGETLAWAHGENPAANALLERSGFTPVRSLYRMALDPALLPAPGTPVEVPDGFTLRQFDPSRTGDAAAWVRVNAAAFASHPEQGRITEDDFAIMRKEPWYLDADLILLEEPRAAEDTDKVTQLAGSTWVKTVSEEDAAPETELYAVGVDPVFAGRGLGRVLLEATLARMAEHAPSRVTLYVDGENERAVRMYEAAGFTIDSRSRQWRASASPEKNVRIDA